jgi:hypothetical protein
MLRKSLIVPVLGLLLLPAAARAQFQQGNWALELSGHGANDKDFRTGSASVDFDLSTFITKELALGVRQSITWADGGSAWNGSTRVVADWYFDMDRWQPYVGVSAGYSYGSGGDDDHWLAGPEVGVKYFVNSTTFVDLRAAYDFDLQEGLDEGGFNYGLGLGFKW